MNIIFISILGLATLSLPTKCSGSAEEQETPLALPLAPQTEPTIAEKDIKSSVATSGNDKISTDVGSTSAVTSGNGGSGGGTTNTGATIATSALGGIAGNNNGGSEIWQEDDREVLIRNVRGTKNNNGDDSGTSCRYVKSPWTECDTKTNTRTRTLTLKKGENGCVPTRTIQKKCKKACRYEKGSWGECLTGQMTRTDKLKPTSDPFCQTTRVINKNCNQGKFKDKGTKERKMKEKGARKTYA